MNVLVIDDDARKQNRITEVIRTAVGAIPCNIECVASVPEAVAKLGMHFDLVILDINLPTRNGEAPVRDGGIRLLKQIYRGGPGLVRPAHILGVTAHSDLMSTAKMEFGLEAWEVLHYDSATDQWEDVVRNKAIHVSAQAAAAHKGEHDYDIAIITALKDVEFDAIQRLPCSWRQFSVTSDDSIYYVGEISGKSHKVRVVATAAIEMGIAASTALAMKVIQRFRPRYLFMAGIAAGINGNPGDILVADESWDYGSGKIVTAENGEREFRFGAKHIQVDAALKDRIAHFSRDRADVIAHIQDRWPGTPSEYRLQVRIGPVATGAAVVEHRETIDEIRSQDRKLIGIDMEAYGVMVAGRIAPEPRPKCIVAKSICDSGTPPKTDDWQRYAAHTSAWFVHDFVAECLIAADSRSAAD